MEPVSLGISAVAIGGGVYYLTQRSELKEGDKEIRKEKLRELKLESERGGSFPTVLHHCFHLQHLFFLGYAGGATRCNLCLNAIERYSNRYSCGENCNINLPTTCALYINMLKNLKENKVSFQTFAHKHPLCTLNATSQYTCKHCKNKSRQNHKYYCISCGKSFHLVCAMHPTRLLSFLHPEHELELKTRPTLQKCVVCHHKGDLSARVYCCVKCGFFVHPDCALKTQIRYHPCHAGHQLIFREVKSIAFCGCCGLRCQYWSYSCSICYNVNFHEECLEKYSTDNKNKYLEYLKDLALTARNEGMREFKKTIKDDFKEDVKELLEDESPIDILLDVIDFFLSLFT